MHFFVMLVHHRIKLDSRLLKTLKLGPPAACIFTRDYSGPRQAKVVNRNLRTKKNIFCNHKSLFLQILER